MSRTATIGFVLFVLAAAPAARAATFVVDSNADDVDAAPGDGSCATAAGSCTLRAAVQEANAHEGADRVSLPAGTYTLGIAGQGEDEAATGDVDITDELELVGSGRAVTTIDANAIDRALDVLATATISGLTVQNGNPGADGYGGGVYCSGIVTLRDVAIVDNTATLSGGGIENDGDLTLIDVTVSGNTAGTTAGGLDNALTATLTNVLFSGNTANIGGALRNDFSMGLVNVTLDANVATTSGGAIRSNAGLDLTNVTIADNTAPAASAIDNRQSVMMKNVIVDNNGPGDSCAGTGTFQSLGNNLDSGNTCFLTAAGDLVDTDPLLAPLADNDGPTETRALLVGSPAIDAGGDCPPPATDQRGGIRPADGDNDATALCDIGAFEFGAVIPTTTSTLPPCTTQASFSSVRCRLAELGDRVAAAVPAGKLHDKLAAAVTAASGKVDAAETAFGEGKARRIKSQLGGAKRAMKKFAKAVSSKKAADLDPTLRTELGTRANELKDSMQALRTTPAS